jgi:cyclohexa-1,5-dienecarbonyl-CoA hydratase
MRAPEPSSPAPIALDLSPAIARIRLASPPLNVLDIDLLQRFNSALRQCQNDSVRVLVISSDIPHAFSAGVDIRDHRLERLQEMLAEVRENARLLLQIQAITIAAVHGSTMGGAAEIALLCDLVIAAENLTFRLPEIELAAFPPVAAAVLPERLPWPVAMRLMLGDPLDARDALKLGLVGEVVPASKLQDVASQRAAHLASLSGSALAALVAATRGSRTRSTLERLDGAIETYLSRVGPSRDAAEGIDAFVQKRAPAWSHS